MTNINRDARADELADPALAMATLDRIVDGANVLKLTGELCRAFRARHLCGSATLPSQPAGKK